MRKIHDKRRIEMLKTIRGCCARRQSVDHLKVEVACLQVSTSMERQSMARQSGRTTAQLRALERNTKMSRASHSTPAMTGCTGESSHCGSSAGYRSCVLASPQHNGEVFRVHWSRSSQTFVGQWSPSSIPMSSLHQQEQVFGRSQRTCRHWPSSVW